MYKMNVMYYHTVFILRTCIHTHTFYFRVAIQHGLPNIATYLKTILKREKLSDEAESLRMRYDTILTSLEQGVLPSSVAVPRRKSLSCEDDGGYFSGNRTRGTLLLPTTCQLSTCIWYTCMYWLFLFVCESVYGGVCCLLVIKLQLVYASS